MSLFETYEQDYSNISNSIAKKLENQLPDLTGDSRKTMIRAIERELDESDEIIQGMEFELASTPSGKSRFGIRLKNCKTDYKNLRMKFHEEASKSTERDELLGSSDKNSTRIAEDQDQRSRILAGTSRLNDASRRLEESHRVALETEQIGVSTLETLRNQRQQIMNAGDTLDDANTFVDRNMRLLKSMTRRMATNRLLSAGIIFSLVVIIILILFIKLS